MTAYEARQIIRTELHAAQSILQRALAAKRNLTPVEAADVDRHTTRADELQPIVDAENRSRDIDDRLGSLRRSNYDGAPETQRGQGTDHMYTGEFRTADGQPIALTKEQRAVDFVHAHGLDTSHDVDRVRAGEILRSSLTGDRSRLNDAEHRAIANSGPSSAGLIVGPGVSAELVDLARAQSRIFQAGARLVPMDQATMTFAKVTTGLTPEWVAEGQESTESDMAFGALILTPKNLAVVARVSLELLMDAPNAGQIVTQEITAAMASEFDRAGLFGTGLIGQPKGLVHCNGINERALGAGNGAAPADYDFLIDAISDVAAANGTATAAIYASRTAASLGKLKEAVNLQPLRVPDMVAALPRFVSNQCPITEVVGSSSDCSTAFVGAWSNLVVGLRLSLLIESSREGSNTTNGSAFHRREVLIRGWMRGDIGVLRANHFSMVRGIRA